MLLFTIGIPISLHFLILLSLSANSRIMIPIRSSSREDEEDELEELEEDVDIIVEEFERPPEARESTHAQSLSN